MVGPTHFRTTGFTPVGVRLAGTHPAGWTALRKGGIKEPDGGVGLPHPRLLFSPHYQLHTMSLQAFPLPQTYPNEITNNVSDVVMYSCTPTTQDDYVLTGDMAYNFLALEAGLNPGHYFPDFLGYPLLSGNAQGPVDPILPTVSTSYGIPPNTTNGSFPVSPSPSPSETSSGPGYNQASPEPSPTPEPSCRNALPVFNHIRGKWCCSVCDEGFRGKWECGRHIKATGKRAKCLGCGKKITSRGDSLKRHLEKYCKGDLENSSLEDAFVEV